MKDLHYWVCDIIDDKEDSFANVQLLVDKGADLLALDSLGFTPLLKAANGNYSRGRPNLKALDFLLARKEYSRVEKIEAMELAGAVILQNVKNASIFPYGFKYWRNALLLRRQTDKKRFGLIEKTRLNLKNVQITEWNTSAELEDVIKHPDKLLIQSFLVRLRIFSSKKWDAIDILFGSNILYDCFGELQHQLRFVEIFNIIWAMLETLLSRSDLRKNGSVQWEIKRVLEKLIDVFLYLQRGSSSEILTKEIIHTSLCLIASANDPFFLIQFVKILSHLPQLLLNKDAMETLCNVHDQHGRKLLHNFLCHRIFSAIHIVDLYATMRLLLNAGCDPNAIDGNGNAPLHFLAEIDERYFFGNLNIIAVLLLDFGAQLSIKNKIGKTAVDVLIRKNERNRIMDQKHREHREIIEWKLPDWSTELPTLTCLSARVIRRNRLPYLKLPISLISMIEKPKLTNK